MSPSLDMPPSLDMSPSLDFKGVLRSKPSSRASGASPKVAVDDANACHMSVPIADVCDTMLYGPSADFPSSTVDSFVQSNIDGVVVQDMVVGVHFGLPKTGNPGHTHTIT
jgi:hypothetical protein